MNLILLATGFALLAAGAEVLVRGASGIARRLGIPPLIVGLTVVAFGTSAPEFAVSVGAAWSGQVDIALGSVVGSNIVNVLLILAALCSDCTRFGPASQGACNNLLNHGDHTQVKSAG